MHSTIRSNYCRLALAAIMLPACSLSAAADDAPANSELIVDQTFEAADLDPKWHINTGKWEVADGVLQAKELPAEKHVAAARYQVETENAVVQFRFRLVGDAQTIHLGFDPAPGESKKSGHLFSVVITPDACKLLKHADKKQPQLDPAETLATKELAFEKDRWYQLRVTTWNNYVTVKIDDQTALKGSHSSFGVKKPTLVFRCGGDGVQIDDLKVWREKK